MPFSMDALNLASLLRQVASVEWRWSLEGWAATAQALGLMEEAKYPSGIVYVMAEGSRLATLSGPNGIYDAQVHIASSRSPSADLWGNELDGAEYEEKLEAEHLLMRRMFDEASSTAEQVLGQPAFKGYVDEAGEEEYPEDEGAIALAWWRARGARLALELRHDAEEVPIDLNLVVAPSE